MNEHDLTSTFAELRARTAPPHRLTPEALVVAGRHARRRRRRTVVAGGALAALCLVLTVAFLGRPHGEDHPVPVPPARHPVSTPAPSDVVPGSSSPSPSPADPVASSGPPAASPSLSPPDDVHR
ncbi:MAG TPA: hypothetical protein VGN37_04915 [Actinocatenispora sp.]